MKQVRSQYATGFTLIELLIVITVISILALIVIPRLMGANRYAKDSTLKGNLHILRKAVEVFHSDTGLYPLALQDLVEKPANGLTDGGDTVAIPNGTWNGPYLNSRGGIFNYSSIPRNPFVNPHLDVADHWTLETTNVSRLGNVSFPTPASTETDASGFAYSTYY